jgi:hypothetical protein
MSFAVGGPVGDGLAATDGVAVGAAVGEGCELAVG